MLTDTLWQFRSAYAVYCVAIFTYGLIKVKVKVKLV